MYICYINIPLWIRYLLCFAKQFIMCIVDRRVFLHAIQLAGKFFKYFFSRLVLLGVLLKNLQHQKFFITPFDFQSLQFFLPY